MVCPTLNFTVICNNWFGGLWKSGGQPKTDIKKLKIEMEQLKAERNDIKSKIEEAKRQGRLASEETQQWQRDLKSLEGQVVSIFEDFTDFQNTIKVGPWGVAGDCKFDIGRSATQITKVTLHAGYIVDSLEISIVDGGNVETKRVGTSGGGGYHSFTLDPGEYINSMVGFVGEYNGESCISQLNFKTNFGNTHGPFGGGGGKEFTIPVTDGRIVGFFGQHDYYLKAIGVYVALNWPSI
ncbi:mannose/glucose-specific lectin-like [Zingiber officinale]|uniref:mannose/glucose-specific lectin-like n=1 Tax=Zingiber officinale TaxID=94328 RepID=UPI001C4CE67C|nr:mannose/glucose-specific lectin-like [Zingiber officinale]